MKRLLLLILTVFALITLASCSSVPKNADPDDCYGYSFNLKIYDYYGDSYDKCDVTVSSAGKGNFKQSYKPDAGICEISLSKGEYTLTVTDKESGKEWNENITVINNGKKTFLEIKTEFGYDRAKTANMLLTQKKEDIVAAYGIFSNETVYEKDTVDISADEKVVSEWLSRDGVLTLSFNDLDTDGYEELYLLRKEGKQLVTQVFYVADDELMSTEEVRRELPEPNFGVCLDLKNYILPVGGAMNICTDIYYYPMYYGDGKFVDISALEFTDGKLLPCMTWSGSGSANVSYYLVTYIDGVENDRQSYKILGGEEDKNVLPGLLEGLGYPALEEENSSIKDAYIGGYGNNCSYYDHTLAVKLCKLKSEYITSDHIQGNESYMKCSFTDNTDTHALFGEVIKAEEFDPYEIPAGYKEIIDLLINGKSSWIYGGEVIPGLPEVSDLYYSCDDLSQVGYALIDIDGNGTDELFIGGERSPGRGFDIFDIYTIKDDKAVHLADSGERYMYYLNNDGTLYNTWSGGASNSGDSWYKMNEAGDALTLTVSVFLDIAPDADESKVDNYWFVSYKEDMSDKKSVTKTEADAIKGKTDKKLIKYRTFEEYNKTY